MKLILCDDVKSLGKKGDIVDVAEGYARNFLLPRKLATAADKGALAQLGEQRKAKERRDAQLLEEAQELARRIESSHLAISAKAGNNGKLFGAVTNADVSAALSRTLGVKLDKHKVELTNQVKALGSFPVEIRLHPKVVAKTTVDVVSE